VGSDKGSAFFCHAQLAATSTSWRGLSAPSGPELPSRRGGQGQLNQCVNLDYRLAIQPSFGTLVQLDHALRPTLRMIVLDGSSVIFSSRSEARGLMVMPTFDLLWR